MMDKSFFMGIDVGGSHITLALVNATSFEMLAESVIRRDLNTNAAPCEVLGVFESAIAACAATVDADSAQGVGLAIPGPFDYASGICRITPAQQKYEQMFGVDFHTSLSNVLGADKPVLFNNDAASFAMGEYFHGGAHGFKRAIVITLGTGFGAAFIDEGRPQTGGEGVTDGGELWNLPWKGGIADDYFTTRGIVGEWEKISGTKVSGAREVAVQAAEGNQQARELFNNFGSELARFLAPWLSSFNAEALVIGGNIALSRDLFIPALDATLKTLVEHEVALRECLLGEQAPIYGAALALTMRETNATCATRPSEQGLDIDSILRRSAQSNAVVIDAPSSTDWTALTLRLDREFRVAGIKPVWFSVSAACNSVGRIDPEQITNIRPDRSARLNILYGTGASQANWNDAVIL